MNGKGDSPRNCFSQAYKLNYDAAFRKTPQQWAKYLGVRCDSKSKKRISKSDFLNL